MTTLVEEVPAPTLELDAVKDRLLTKIVAALRTLETHGDVRQVIASPSHGVIVVIGGEPHYAHCALRVVS